MFIFREWRYLRCILANTKCTSVMYKYGKQETKTIRNRVRATEQYVPVTYICWPIIESFPSLQSPRVFRAKNREVISSEDLHLGVLIPLYLQPLCTELP